MMMKIFNLRMAMMAIMMMVILSDNDGDAGAADHVDHDEGVDHDVDGDFDDDVDDVDDNDAYDDEAYLHGLHLKLGKDLLRAP